MTIGTLLFKHAAGSHNSTLNMALWVAQVILAVIFAMSGVMKAFYPIEDLAVSMAWTNDLPETLVRFIGTMELAGAVGLLVPALLRFMPILTAWAGFGLTTIMVLATGFHLLRGELTMAPIPFVIGILAAFVAWGRFDAEPIEPAKD